MKPQWQPLVASGMPRIERRSSYDDSLPAYIRSATVVSILPRKPKSWKYTNLPGGQFGYFGASTATTYCKLASSVALFELIRIPRAMIEYP